MRAFDLVIVGGGLAGGLCALALRRRRPELRLLIVEPDATIGGNHLWSFFESDVAPAHRWLTDPVIGHRWNGYDVLFPAHRRYLEQTYLTIESEALDKAVRSALDPEEIRQSVVTSLGPTHVVLDPGERIEAAAVLDARGGKAEGLDLGWQKFVGQLLTIPQGHGLAHPIVMDASVEQHDGYRFVYCLPFSPTELFVEDTYYSDGTEIDHDLLRERIGDYAAAHGWQVATRTREEHGALPVVTGGNFDRLWPKDDPVARAGARGGFFHPLTSYSLPDAVRFAIWLAEEAPMGAKLGAATRARARKHWKRGAFYRLLTALLFGAAAPNDRYRVLERFYRLSGPLIARFYAGSSTGLDKVRILSGKPPVPLFRALRVLKEQIVTASPYKNAIVIGAGFGGLALAIRLQSAGVQTTIVEARDRPGGRAYVWEKDGHVFDAGPTVITDPDCLQRLWKLSGHDMAEDVDLVPVKPFYRLSWPDGVVFDYTNDDAELKAAMDALNPNDWAGYQRFLAYSAGVFNEGYVKLGTKAFESIGDMLKAAPALAKYQAWRSVYSMVSSFVEDEHLRQALSFHTLLVGGNPMTCSSIYALIHKLERDGGVWFARGGTNKLIAGMVRHFERIGGTIRLGDPVTAITAENERVTGVRTRSGWSATADAVASNGDVVHSYGLIEGSSRGPQQVRALKRKRFSPGLFVLHFGLEGTFDIAHHTILFGPRYGGLVNDIYKTGRLATDPALYLHHPTITDPSMAPPGCSTFYALAPVPNAARADVDWAVEGPKYQEVVLDTLAERLIPDIRSRIRTIFHYTPADFSTDLAAHLGSAFSLEPVLWQSAWFRTHNRDDKLHNLYFVGAGTHPGAGIPGVVGSAEATAGLMLA